MPLLESDSFHGLAAAAIEACKDGPVFNLVLHSRFPIAELDAPFLDGFKSTALKWQESTVPRDMVFNHGEYMRGALDHVSDELHRKADSNRACAVLMCTRDFIGRGDEPIPSFLLVQFGLDDSGQGLYISTYYRALEVVEFLPVNLAETALMAKSVISGYEGIVDIDVTVHAFRAHATPGFNLFKRASLDLVERYDIFEAVVAGDAERISSWINSKLVVESHIDTSALDELCKAIQRQTTGFYSADVSENLAAAISSMERLRELRCKRSNGAEVTLLVQKIQTSLKAARDGLA